MVDEMSHLEAAKLIDFAAGWIRISFGESFCRFPRRILNGTPMIYYTLTGRNVARGINLML